MLATDFTDLHGCIFGTLCSDLCSSVHQWQQLFTAGEINPNGTAGYCLAKLILPQKHGVDCFAMLITTETGREINKLRFFSVPLCPQWQQLFAAGETYQLICGKLSVNHV